MPNIRYLLPCVFMSCNCALIAANSQTPGMLKFAQSKNHFLDMNACSSGLRSIDAKSDKRNIGFLLSSKIDAGKLVEQYSNGLLVEIDPDGNRKELQSASHFEMEAKVPGSYSQKDCVAVDDFIKNVVHLGRMKGQSSSFLQSRLFQYSSYYLSLGETSKAQALIKEFFEIQNRIHEKGEPFTDAEKKYRLALKGAE